MAVQPIILNSFTMNTMSHVNFGFGGVWQESRNAGGRMSIHIHWYLPTNGDSREITGSGDEITCHCRCVAIELSGADHRLPRGCRTHGGAPRLRGGADANRHLVRGCVDHNCRAQPAHHAAQIPRRLPARASHADARRAPGGDVPAHPRAAGCCSTSLRAATRSSSAASATGWTTTSAMNEPASS